jgi:hypothetical protein
MQGVPPAEAQTVALPTLTTMGAVHRLTPQEAAKAYPVRLRGVVTYYTPYLLHAEPILIASDATGSVYISDPGRRDPALNNGVRLDVTGRTAAGDFGPIVNHATLRSAAWALCPPMLHDTVSAACSRAQKICSGSKLKAS